MQRITHTLAGLLLASSASLAFAQTAAPDNAKVFFISPKDGATVSSPVTVQFGLEGMGVAPAGVEREATGHHHLLSYRLVFLLIPIQYSYHQPLML